MSGTKTKFMTWFKGGESDSELLARKLHDVLDKSNSTLEELSKEMNEGRIEMARFTATINAELVSINKSLDENTKTVHELQKSLFGNNGTKGLFPRVNEMEKMVSELRDSYHKFKDTCEISKEKVDKTSCDLLQLVTKIENKEKKDQEDRKWKVGLVVTAFSGSAIFVLKQLWEVFENIVK